MNQRRFTESIVLFDMVNCFKMFLIKMEKEKREKKRTENPKIIIVVIIIAKIFYTKIKQKIYHKRICFGRGSNHGL